MKPAARAARMEAVAAVLLNPPTPAAMSGIATPLRSVTAGTAGTAVGTAGTASESGTVMRRSAAEMMARDSMVYLCDEERKAKSLISV